MTDTETPDLPEEKNKGGQRLKSKTVDELQVAIDSYFDACDSHLESRLVESGINWLCQPKWDPRIGLSGTHFEE